MQGPIDQLHRIQNMLKILSKKLPMKQKHGI